MEDYERLGAFYLGRELDPSTREPGPLVLMKSRDLTTHGLIIGMTGSGKTGLAIGLLEEAGIDGIPVIAIDPKGDLGNLLLSFPEMAPEDFRPWVEEEASAKGLDPAVFAAQEATRWREGLASWGQTPDRIRRLRERVELAIYTPGASVRPLAVLKGFDAPPEAVRLDPSSLAERVRNTVSGLLGLLGIEADPLRSREHLLLTALLTQAWSAGQGQDLGGLVGAVRQPPFDRIGVMDIETFYPEKDRFELALLLNGLLASPAFATWAEGEPLDVRALLWTPEGRPRISVISIAHLPDPERMFLVTRLLDEILAWTRAQPGTPSLRALLYMDEVFGFFPPVATPPAKAPMLALLKQARAFGLGVVLATQNPVDLDYKGLGNAGTWFVGRLQTERDVARVVDALEAAAAGTTRAELSSLLAGLTPRTFLLHSVHAPRPVLMSSRWALSYLRGPLTLPQIATLSPPPASGPSAQASTVPAASAGTPLATASQDARPILPPDVPQFFAPLSGPPGGRVYRARVLGAARVRTVNAKAGVDTIRPVRRLATPTSGPVPIDWSASSPFEIELTELDREPVPEVPFEPPVVGLQARTLQRWGKDLARWLQANGGLLLLQAPRLGLVSRPDEPEAEFRIRVAQASRESRDAAVETLRARYADRVASLTEKIRRAEARVQTQAAQANQKKLETAVSMGMGILGGFFGRSSLSTRAGSAIRTAGRAYQESKDVDRARQDVEAARARLEEVEARIHREIETLETVGEEPLVPLPIAPRASDVSMDLVAVLWVPETA
ncbi:MAG: DUF853 family protein [Deltaproteobacteria bacterium]|nr:DUF853 family protein [Deltaproteobacteria bacterium]